jgi:hypothetical protein
MASKKSSAMKFTVPEVWRTIVKKNERQAGKLYDVLVCDHSVPANDNTYRKARSCPECRIKVQQYADQQRAQEAAPMKDLGPASAV